MLMRGDLGWEDDPRPGRISGHKENNREAETPTHLSPSFLPDLAKMHQIIQQSDQ